MRNFENLMSILLPIFKKVVSNQINKTKSRMRKIQPNKIENTPKRVSNRKIKSLENNFSVNATKNNTPKIATEKPSIATKPKIAKPKIDDKPETATKPKIAIKSKIV